ASRSVRAGDRARTGDPQLGKLMLYQLSYARNRRAKIWRAAAPVKMPRALRAFLRSVQNLVAVSGHGLARHEVDLEIHPDFRIAEGHRDLLASYGGPVLSVEVHPEPHLRPRIPGLVR